MSTISIQGRTCSYQDIGKGPQTILFGHSYLWTSDMWEPQLKVLSETFRCIVPDLWDHGKSGHLNTKNMTVEQIADDYWELMQRLEIPEFTIVGLSVGGMWGLQLAIKHPDAVKALVLMDTAAGSEPSNTQQKYFALLNILEQEKRFSDSFLDKVVPLFFSPKSLTEKPQLVENFRKSLTSINSENIQGIVALGRAIFSRECLLDKLPNLVQPAMIIVGKDDIPRPPEEAQEMTSRLPNCKIHVIENAGHISNLEQPEQITSLLLEFLSKHACEVVMHDD